MAVWATIWATCDTARFGRAAPDGPADRAAGLLEAMAGLAALAARCAAFLMASRLRRCAVADGALLGRFQQSCVMALHRFVAFTRSVLQCFGIANLDFPAGEFDQTGRL